MCMGIAFELLSNVVHIVKRGCFFLEEGRYVTYFLLWKVLVELCQVLFITQDLRSFIVEGGTRRVGVAQGRRLAVM